jgi:hypothetical protein
MLLQSNQVTCYNSLSPNKKSGNPNKKFYSFFVWVSGIFVLISMPLKSEFPYFFIWISGIRQKKQKKFLFGFPEFSFRFPRHPIRIPPVKFVFFCRSSKTKPNISMHSKKNSYKLWMLYSG